MHALQPEQVEAGLVDHMIGHVDLGRLPALIATAIKATDQPELAARMLRQGAAIRLRPRYHADRPQPDGHVEVVLEFGQNAELLSALRAAARSAQPEDPPPVGSPERERPLALAGFPFALVCALPEG